MTQQLHLFALRTSSQASKPVTIKELPTSDQPLHRLSYMGTNALSLSELLALLIGSDNGPQVARNLLTVAGSMTAIAQLTFHDLIQIHGIGPATAARIKAATEISVRLRTDNLRQKPQIRTPADVADLLMLEMGLLDHEQLRVVLLDTKNQVQDIVLLYKGSLNTAVVRVGEVFREALRRNMASIVLVHNHPSTDPTPSPEDVRLTEKIVEAGNLLNIDVLDHLVICQNRFVSLKERGLGFRS
ncbi:MAG: DNA repair protein RadC [Caldilineaceae bacterium]|nr:DNA repair protein RadC [Caldilineaceae bacterium]